MPPRRSYADVLVAATLIAALGALPACRSGAPRDEIPIADPSRPAPAYADVAARYNERASRLGRLWASAVVELRYTDSKGKRRWEQGEGALQRIAPDRFSLSVNKLGERIALVGCNAERFWLIEFADDGVASVGLNENIASPCCEPTGLPASPLDIVDMLGVLPMPVGPDAARANASVGWTPRGDDLRVEFDVRSGRMRIEYPPAGVGPSRIALLTASSIPGEPMRETLVARLDSYEPVDIRGEGTIRPRLASRVIITSVDAKSEVRLTLSEMSSGSAEKLPDESFDFDYLIDVFSPRHIIVLDRRCPRSAVSVPSRSMGAGTPGGSAGSQGAGAREDSAMDRR